MDEQRVGKKKPKGNRSKAGKSAGDPKGNQKDNKKQPHQGRLVITHSTYVPGLIALLEKLATQSEIQTITPAVISRAKSNSPQLRLKVSAPITGGHKLIARKGKSAQEVFVITPWSKAELEGAIARILA